MKHFNLCICAIVVFFVAAGVALAQDNKESSVTVKVPLRQRLVEIGQTYNCFFTLEEAWEADESRNVMESRESHTYARKQGLILELDELRQNVPNVRYEIDKNNPRIIHVIDSRLTQSNYGLESIINNIDFNGRLHELITTIAKQKIPIALPILMDIHEGMFQDTRTTIQVKGNNLKVRDALSEFIPLAGRSRILWIARTKLGENQISYIHFVGPSPKHKN